MCEVPTPREVWRKDGRTGDGETEQVGVRSIGHRGMKDEERQKDRKTERQKDRKLKVYIYVERIRK